MSALKNILIGLLLFGIVAGCSKEKEKKESPYGDSSLYAYDTMCGTKVTTKNDSTQNNTPSVTGRQHFHVVEIKGMKFVPEEITVAKGDTIEWINKDITTHDVTEEPTKAWTSSPLVAGKSWSTVVKKTSDYYCSLHVVMKGKIVVR
jgi:plastocyanin